MYRCQQTGCSKVTPPKKPKLVITITTPVSYEPDWQLKNGRKYGTQHKNEVTRGSEIVKEIPVCAGCYLDHKEALAKKKTEAEIQAKVA